MGTMSVDGELRQNSQCQLHDVDHQKVLFRRRGDSGYTNICVAKRYKFYIRITVPTRGGMIKGSFLESALVR